MSSGVKSVETDCCAASVVGEASRKLLRMIMKIIFIAASNSVIQRREGKGRKEKRREETIREETRREEHGERQGKENMEMGGEERREEER